MKLDHQLEIEFLGGEVDVSISNLFRYVEKLCGSVVYKCKGLTKIRLVRER